MADVKSQWLLPDGTISVLSFVERDNPNNRGWAPMKLYLTKHVRERSYARWGGEEGLEAERRRRQEKKCERSVKASRAFIKGLRGGGSAGGGGFT